MMPISIAPDYLFLIFRRYAAFHFGTMSFFRFRSLFAAFTSRRVTPLRSFFTTTFQMLHPALDALLRLMNEHVRQTSAWY